MSRIHAQRGYVALMTVIIVSLVLLVATGEQGLAGFLVRQSVLGIEHKEQSHVLAQGCVQAAIAALAADPAYGGGDTLALSDKDVCVIDIAKPGVPVSEQVTFETHASVDSTETSLRAVVDIHSAVLVSQREILTP